MNNLLNLLNLTTNFYDRGSSSRDFSNAFDDKCSSICYPCPYRGSAYHTQTAEQQDIFIYNFFSIFSRIPIFTIAKSFF